MEEDELVLQDRLPFAPWLDERARKLPGIMPLERPVWLTIDEAYKGQLEQKEKLLKDRFDDVHAVSASAMPAAQELLEVVFSELSKTPGFEVGDAFVIRPDGAHVDFLKEQPLVTLSKLVQEDFVILEKQGDEHVITGALLCFPASWTLSQKFLKPLVAVHDPVEPYDANIARRVQRLFDGIKVGRPIWRANALHYRDPALFQPRLEEAPRQRPKGRAKYLRSERQTLVRLPKTNAVVFAIHTCLVRYENLTQEQKDGLLCFQIDEVGT